MKNIFDESTRQELIDRISALNTTTPALWGEMNAFQMTRHCILWNEMILQNKKYRRPFIGLLLGRLLLKVELRDSPMRHNNPTLPDLIVNQTSGDIDTEKKKWISSIHEYSHYDLPDNSFVHPYFGKMTKAQIGYHAYKHLDHHLRQFGL